MPDLRQTPFARSPEPLPEMAAPDDGPMSDLQAAELRMLADRAGAPVPIHLSCRQAQDRIVELRGG